jgi:1,4-alpha-glucan branching enzyme
MNVTSRGYLMLVLHAHLPYVRHPEHPYFLEEHWFYEAITETYLPLLDVLERLTADGVAFRLTMTITPPLAEMLSNPLLLDRYTARLANLRELADREVDRNRNDPDLLPLAEFYRDRLARCHEQFHDLYQRDLVAAFRKLMEAGALEIITCGATHGFLPNLRVQPEAVRAQVEMGCRAYERHFGRRPQGIWNGECGYYPGLEEVLAEAGLSYFFIDTHGIIYADKRPPYGVYAPLQCPNGILAWGRDTESSKSVWSAQEGYPGHADYREFYRDLAWERDADYIAPYVHPDGHRHMTGLKYHRITGKTEKKEWYNPSAAAERSAEHARDFVQNRRRQVEHLAGLMDRPPVIVAPYDAELFGHWWYEGPLFLEALLREVAAHPQEIGTLAAPDYMAAFDRHATATPSFSSWGSQGYGGVWTDDTNDWIYPLLHTMAETMVRLANDHPEPDDEQRCALNQAARELLLAQSSDWAFIMKMRTTVEYAESRTQAHVARFEALARMLKEGRIDSRLLATLEKMDDIFPDIDYTLYNTKQ